MMATWQPGYLIYAKCCGCKCWRLVPVTHPAARGQPWLCFFCELAVGRWLNRELGRLGGGEG
jgi:hypothetical protein